MGRRKKTGRARILIVAFMGSVHTARWIAQLDGAGFDVHLFPSVDSGEQRPHEDLVSVTVHRSVYVGNARSRIRTTGLRVANRLICRLLRRLLRLSQPDRQARHLAATIRSLRPAIVHSLETQHAGYLVAAARRSVPEMPPWIHTNWGSDIYLFGRFEEHKSRIREVLLACDYYTCECTRDAELARRFGLKGPILETMPNTGGFHLDELMPLRSIPPSRRRLIVLKGYQGWAGRALVAVRALALAADALRGFRVVAYSCDEDSGVITALRLLEADTGIPVAVQPPQTPHKDMLALHAAARVSIGLSISDSISTSFLEAIVMGSFPIQSWTSAAGEWIRDGQSGILVPPEDPHIVATAIRRAVSDDALVDAAADTNWQVARDRLSFAQLRDRAIGVYQRVLGSTAC